MNDGDGANYPITFRSNRWYLRLVCWTVERAVHGEYTIIIFLADEEDGNEEWKRYTSRQDGRYKFQIDLALQLLEYAIKLDWPAPYEESKRPAWVRQKAFIPCNCGVCFFCKNGMTTGIAHKPKLPFRPGVVPRGHAADRAKVTRTSRACTFCYSKFREQYKKTKNKKQILKLCNTTNKGCPKCGPKGTIVCEVCWNSFVHTA